MCKACGHPVFRCRRGKTAGAFTACFITYGKVLEILCFRCRVWSTPGSVFGKLYDVR